MRKLFTFFVALVVMTTVGFAQKGGQINLPSELEGKVSLFQDRAADKDTEILLPGLWDQVTQVGMYQWTDADDNPLGWIYGNNSNGGVGAGSKFNVATAKEVVGAYFWFGSVADADADIVFGIYEFADEAVGDLIASVTVNLADITELPTTGLTPGDYVDAYYVTFDTPVAVQGDFFVGFDASDVTYTAHGDGLGLVSSHQSGGGGAGHGYILHNVDGWELASVWNAALNFDLAVFPEVQDPGSAEGYTVTFNVDMNNAEGFDPATHSVWVTGNFTGWAEPGTEGSVEMTLVGSKDTPPFTLSESFEGFADWTTDLSPWVTLQVTTGPTYGSENFDFPGAGEEWAWKAFNPSGTDPAVDATHPAQEGSKYAVAIQYTSTNDDKWLISPEVSINETSELSFWGKSITDQYGMERIQVLVSTTDTETGSFTKISDGEYIEVPTTWTEYTFDLSAYAGETIHFAIRYMSFDAFIFMLDNIQLTAESGPQDLTYTATVNDVPEGELLYKYFSDAVDEGFDGGEWTGEPNRSVMVSADVVLNDVWAQYGDVSVEDTDAKVLSVYPNPVSNILNIQSGEQIDNLRIFDLSGRVVFNADIMDFNTTIDVSRFNNGIYILQLISGQQVTTRKIQVVK